MPTTRFWLCADKVRTGYSQALCTPLRGGTRYTNCYRMFVEKG
jgi:hypothetical protein